MQGPFPGGPAWVGIS